MEYKDRILKVRDLLKEADYVLIGAGAGLSTAAGMEYSGESFEKNYREFIDKYYFDDLYSASFYDFKTQEEKWAFFARMIKLNRYNDKPLQLYQELYELVCSKDYFVLSTNVDGQFYNSGFDAEKVFEVQGDYCFLQCENACHDKLYYNKELVEKWIQNTKDCKILSDLVMKCPVCGGNMDMNLRKDANFVQDKNWYVQAKKYEEFINNAKDKKMVLLEIGVGFNTPGIIRFPFERMVEENEDTYLVRINKEYPSAILDINDKLVSFNENVSKIIGDLK